MRKLQCDLCGGPLTVRRAGSAPCAETAGWSTLWNGCGIAGAAMHVKPGGPLVVKLFPCPPPDVAGWLCDVLNRLRAEWPATVLLVTDHA